MNRLDKEVTQTAQTVRVCGEVDLAKIAASGQCFRMQMQVDGTGLLIAYGRVLHVRQTATDACELLCSQEEYEALWHRYFDMDTDYAAIRARVPTSDEYLTQAAAAGYGIRILRQDPWEMLITFILSQRKNIPAIKACVEALCTAAGRRIANTQYYAFPTPAQLASLSEAQLRGLALGYRAPYVHAAAQMAADGVLDFDALAKLPDEPLLEALLQVPGVGVKVANCTLLFGFHRLARFPRDVWINRVLDEQYGGEFPLERYPGCGGVIQQYMFAYARAQAGRGTQK